MTTVFKKNCDSDFVIQLNELLGEGAEGAVFKACKKDPHFGCNYVAKVSSSTNVDKKKEIRQQLKAAAVGLAPALHESFFCDKLDRVSHGTPFEKYEIPLNAHITIMDRVYGIPASEQRVNYSSRKDHEALCQSVKLAIDKLHSLNIFHGDLNPSNILISQEKPTAETKKNSKERSKANKKIQFIDFGNYSFETLPDIAAKIDLYYALKRLGCKNLAQKVFAKDEDWIQAQKSLDTMLSSV